MKAPHAFLPLLAATLCAMALASCSTAKKVTARHVASHPGISARPTKEQLTLNIDPRLPDAQLRLLTEAKTWLGVPYRWGGNDREGVDCSGFVSQVYLRALEVKLPRTSVTQSEYCSGVTRSSLVPGDLVFFDTTGEREGRVTHVGLYVGDGNMIHASTSKGVIVSPIDGVYYGERLLGGGRVEPAPIARQAPAASPAPAAPAASPAPLAAPFPAAEPAPAAPAAAPTPAAAARPSTAAEARALVLESLVEQKLDSIFN